MSQINASMDNLQRQLIDNELFRITGQRLSSSTARTSSSGFSANISSSVVSATTIESSATSLDVICQVQCKLTHRFCSHLENAFEVVIGSIVIISGDGSDSFDIGVVVKIYSLEQYDAKMSSKRPSNDKEESEIRKVLRLATTQECQLLPSKYAEEEQLLAECQAMVAVQHLPMIVYGADFQMDGKVLTFYYTSDTRADYRALVRTMFNKCMVRIKMRKTNQCKKFVPIAFATHALKTGVVNKDIR